MSNRFGGFCECGDHAWARLTRGHVCLVSPEDAALIRDYCWTALTPNRTAYAYRMPRIEGAKVMIYLHRAIMLPAADREVDHRNGDGIDCRRPNMHEVTHRENLRNITRLSHRNKSGYRGVYPTASGRWSVLITCDGKQHNGGTFDDLAIAAARAIQLRGELHAR